VPLFDVVVPARNEESTVGDVVRAALGAHGVGRVVVVDDGSSDRTAAEARSAGAAVVAGGAPGIAGKGRALDLGVQETTAPVLVFFDADILDARAGHFEALAEPILAGGSWLSLGLLDYGPLRNPLFLRLPPITGLRALRREVFEAVAPERRHGFRIEIMINEVVARRRLPSTIRVLHGLRHRTKVDKAGWRAAFPSYLAMTGELLGCLHTVPLWTYGAYLRHLSVLPPVASSAPLRATYTKT
jgi:glycosyltransferase involved in cell wall biosynthesis